jgi:aspartyl-tRNA(Asn)/glutamyl-tRNA(Gln) amidotransferase subunit B
MTWEPVIGLEIHCQLNTKTKMFSSDHNRFGDEPNTNISSFSTGQPGTLPLVNAEAVRKGVQFGCAVEADVALFSSFDRKSYFYPDLPDGYQITQFFSPLIRNGKLHALVGDKVKTFEIDHAHLENDTGMLKHFSSFSGIDYNRAGAPLIEIVSAPCMHSPEEAAAFARGVRAVMHYLDASDCNMEEGSLRIDINVSIRKPGEGLRNKTEIKNINSFNNLQKALHYEIDRQIAFYEENPNESLPSVTCRWDIAEGKTVVLRAKNTAQDYRYFPEPNLLPLELTPQYIEDVRKTLPELPLMRWTRYQETLGLSEYSASLLVQDKILCDYFERALSYYSNPKALCNWITVEFAGRLKDKGPIYNSKLLPEHVAELVKLIDEGSITGKIAKHIADDMLQDPTKSPSAIASANPDYQPMDDEDALEAVVVEVLKENPDSIATFLSGRDRAFGFLVGQVMKKTGGKANPKRASDLLKEKIKKQP